jgi:hypothetical protein
MLSRLISTAYDASEHRRTAQIFSRTEIKLTRDNQTATASDFTQVFSPRPLAALRAR